MRRVKKGLAATALVATVVAGVAIAGGDPGKLRFQQAKFDGMGDVQSLADAYDVAVSGDDEDVYVVSRADHAVTVFKRRARTGKLRFVEAEVQGENGVEGLLNASDVAVAPGGDHVYVAADSGALAAFERNHRTGKLSFIEALFDGVDGVDGIGEACCDMALSPDGRFVYVPGGGVPAIATFKRNRGTGRLEFVNARFDGVDGVEGIGEGAYGVEISPDGENVYVTGDTDNAVATFDRNPTTGKLHFVNAKVDGVGGVEGLVGPCCGLGISRDGRSLYVPTDGDDSVAVFKRSRRTGKLHFLQAKFDGAGGVEFKVDPLDAIVSRDGRNVYVAAFDSNAVVIFRRRDSGRLRFIGAKRDGVGGVDGIEGGWQLDLSGDDKSLYVAGFNDDALAVFRRKLR
jgi:6-phosphogluconolactonase (cycloisomerase 2 family)